jgi:hypothetical protein
MKPEKAHVGNYPGRGTWAESEEATGLFVYVLASGLLLAVALALALPPLFARVRAWERDRRRRRYRGGRP